ncbi:MAG: YfhO family protein [Patescibacteria group bacterium]
MKFLEDFLQKWWGSLTASVFIMMLVYWPFLFSDKVIGGDPLLFNIPYLNFLKENIFSGMLWNPQNAGGFPIYASLGGFFFPLHWIFIIFFSATVAFYWLIFLSSVFALFFTILFLKELGLGIHASIIGGLSFVISEQYFFGHITSVAYSLVLLPLLFLIILKINKSERPRWYVFWGGLAIGLSWLSITPHFVLWIIIAAGFFAIYLAIKNTEKRKRILFSFVLINIVGIMIGAVQIWPTFWVAQMSSRGMPIPYNLLSEHSIRPVDLPRFFLPDFYSDLPIYISRDNATQGSEESLYVGAIPFLFLAASFFIRVPFLRFFRWLFLASLAIGLKYSPLFWIITKIPILNAFRVPSRFMLIGSFASAILIGLAADFFIKKESQPEKKSALILLSVIGISAILVTLAFVFYFRIKYIKDFNNVVVYGKMLIPFLFLVIGYLSMKFLYGEKYSRLPLLVLIFITVFDFVLVSAFSFDVNDPISYKYKELSNVGFLRANPGRYITLFPEELDKQLAEGGDEIRKEKNNTLWIKPNLNLFYGLDSGGYYEKLLSFNTSRLWKMILVPSGELFVSPYPKEDIKSFEMDSGLSSVVSYDLATAPIAVDEKIKILKKRLFIFNFLGVRYILSSVDFSPLGLGRAFILPFVQSKKTGETVGLSIYDNSDAKPTFYFVKKINGFGANNDNIFQNFIESGLAGEENPIFVKCADCDSTVFSAMGNIELQEKKNTLFKVKTDSADNQFLIFSQNNYPGWKAFVDGKEAKIYEVNTVYMGVFIPPGEHIVDFKYSYYLPDLNFFR